MYTYIRAAGAYYDGPVGAQLVDISEYKVSSIFNALKRINIIVTNSYYPDQEFNLDLYDYYNELHDYELTIQDWLDTQSGNVLKVSNAVFGSTYRYVLTWDMEYKGFYLYPGDTALGTDRQDLLTPDNAPDIRMLRPDRKDIKYKTISKISLYTINGHFVRCNGAEDALYLLDVGKHFKVNNNIHVHCYNFNGISTLGYTPITSNMVYFDNSTGSNHINLVLDKDVSKKKVWLVIAGKLYTDDVISVTGVNTVQVKINAVNWNETLFNSQNLIDLSPIITPETKVLKASYLKSKTFFYSLLTHSTSFVIIFDNPDISTEYGDLETLPYPSSFQTYEREDHPLRLENGLFPSYITRDVGNQRLLDIDIPITKVYLNRSTGADNGGGLYHNTTGRFEPVNLVKGHLFKIKTLTRDIINE